MFHSSALSTIGNTPLIELRRIEEKYHLKGHIYAKVEGFNLGGSIKSRPAKLIIQEAVAQNLITKDTIVIEPTSGNMGISLSLICGIMNIPFIAIMPDNVSKERRSLIAAYGGQVELTPAKDGMKGCFVRLDELKEQYSHVYVPSQFTNPLSVQAHYETTGPEILRDLPNVEALVAGIGTGGTIMGVSKRLKEDHSMTVIGVEPKTSPMISKGQAGKHEIQGIGANFYPPLLEKDYIDEMELIDNDEAFEGAEELAKEEGLFVGISSGAAYKAALKAAQSGKYEQIVVILPDFGERYLSTLAVRKEKNERIG